MIQGDIHKLQKEDDMAKIIKTLKRRAVAVGTGLSVLLVLCGIVLAHTWGSSYSGSGTGLSHTTSGGGQAFYGRSNGTGGIAIYAYNNGSGQSEAVYGLTSSNSGSNSSGVMGGNSSTSSYTVGTYGLHSATSGTARGVKGSAESPSGIGVWARNGATSGTAYGLYASSYSSTGWSGMFHNPVGNGVYITAASDKIGLTVSQGTKNAVVRTSAGPRALYTEESTEVWFSDYGFGQIQDGVARLAIDPLFAETVDLDQPYHVFLQSYDDATLIVSDRTASDFEVLLRDGDPNAQFSYRLVAHRKGYVGRRLEIVEQAKTDPNLYPEKKDEWKALNDDPSPILKGL